MAPKRFISAAVLLQVHVTEIAIRLDFKLDESYTPNRLSIRAGTSFHDLREIKIVALQEVTGWVMIPLEPPDHPWVALSSRLAACSVCISRQIDIVVLVKI